MSTNTTQTFNQKMKEHVADEDERLTQFLSEKYKLSVVHINDIEVQGDALQLVKEADAREAAMAIYKRLKGVLTIAINEPNNVKLAEVIRDLEGRGYDVTMTMASLKTLTQIWEYYRDIVATSATRPGTLSITNEDLEIIAKNIQSIEEVKEVFREFKEMPRSKKVSKNVEYLMATAIAIDASDIHFEPSEDGGIVRYRIDGVLTDITTLEEQEFKQVLIRMKLLSNMKITSKGSQDGGFVTHLPQKTISIRSSIIPEEHGGAFVARILDPENVIKDIDYLGLHPTTLTILKRHIRKPNGMILTTGPTGSGKTTTLYSLLNLIKDESIKVITIENPIEYRLKGIVQTETDSEYTFASGLRSILRQDPDVILVGEVRDQEVASIAVQASLTGHLVLSTIHANDEINTFSRFEQFEIDRQTLSRSINVVIAQRLIRRLCPLCSEPHPLTDAQKKTLAALIQKLPESYKTEPLSFDNIRRVGKNHEGCTSCTGGYKGRCGIYGIFELDDEIRQAYEQEEGDILKLKNHLKKKGFPFIEDDGIYKLLTGTSSIEELERVLGLLI